MGGEICQKMEFNPPPPNNLARKSVNFASIKIIFITATELGSSY